MAKQTQGVSILFFSQFYYKESQHLELSLKKYKTKNITK